MTAFRYERHYTGPLTGIVLDWAGTTMDYGCYAPAVVFTEVYRRNRVAITIEEARAPMGAHKLVHIRKISQIPAVARRWREEHDGQACTEADVEAMFEEFVPLQIACLADYADLIPGTLAAVAAFRERGLKIGSTTGYTIEMMEVLLGEARKRGYEPDSTVCASEVPEGRPAPWMCLENAKRIGRYPVEAWVKVDDTLPGIEEGLNAGMWTIGLAKTGNEIGLNEAEITELSTEELALRLEGAYGRLQRVGAHYVVDDITGVADCLDDIERRLARGERP